MALAVCLLFDPRADRTLRQLWGRLEEHGIPTLLTHTHRGHVPHVSYAVYRTFEVDRVRSAVADLAPVEPVTLHFDAVALFRRRRAALVAAATPELLARQAEVVAAGEATGADLHVHYRPGLWIPHASLATSVRREDVATAATTAFEVLPLRAVADRVALVDSSTGRRWDLPAP